MPAAPSRFEQYLAKLDAGTLTYLDATDSSLEPLQRAALLNGMAIKAANGALGTEAEVAQPQLTGDHTSAPTGYWSSLTFQATDANVTVNGLTLGIGDVITLSADAGKTIPVPALAGEYLWTGYKL